MILFTSLIIQAVLIIPTTHSYKDNFQQTNSLLEGDVHILRNFKTNNALSFNCGDKPRISRFPDPNDCSKFIYCVAGLNYPGNCPKGMTFNPKTSHCDFGNVSTSCLPPIPVPQNVLTKTTESSLVLEKPSPSPTPTTMQSQPSRPSALKLPSTPKPPLLKDKFEFKLDCKNKHPCGLYPNTDGDCSSFFLCENGMLISKHCHGGQLFDIVSLECVEPSLAKCWTEPNSGILPITPRISASCQFHNKSHSESHDNATDGIILSNPLVTNWGAWQSWTNCPSGYWITGINAWRRLLQQGQAIDHAGLVSLAFQCEKISESPSSTTIIESLAPGVPRDGWSSFFSCSGDLDGVGIGFRLNSQKDQGSIDNVATDNVQVICSCGPPVYKDYENIPGPQTGHRGDWTEEQICKPRQVLCGMQTQMADYRERVLGSYDNTGLNNLKMKCCNVPDPAQGCLPKEERMLIRKCENTQGIYSRRCDFEVEIGLGYDLRNGGGLKAINFYESIGFSLEYSLEQLKLRFLNELRNNGKGGNQSIFYEYNWEESEEDVWKAPSSNTTSRVEAIYLEVGTKVELYQIVGICDHFLVKANRFIKNVFDGKTGNVSEEYFDI